MAVGFKSLPLGETAELKACTYLQNKGLSLIDKNYRRPCGEIDLIMQEGDEIVFVEVRHRSHAFLGHAIETVNKNKQRKLLKTALLYLQKKGWLNTVNCRFDVIGINNFNEIEWIQNAFSLDFV